jgi:hypothetical protein
MKGQQPLLADTLTDTQRALLASLQQHPGYPVLELLHMEACKRATEDVIRVNPEEENAIRKVEVRQLRARERNEFSLLILKSIQWHVDAAAAVGPKKEEEPEQNRILRSMPK